MTARYERRAFLGRAGLGAAALLAGYAATAKGFAANETLNVGCIGTGGRCRYLMNALKRVPGVRVTAVCDVSDESLAAGRALADPNAFATKRHEELLARRDVDAVIVGTPDHWHVPMTVAACEAGKDVYVEKPLTHDLAEGAAVLAARDKSKRVVQVGTQQRSMPQFRKGDEIVRSGRLGEIVKVRLSWNRNAPRARRPENRTDPNSVDWKRFLGTAPDQPFDDYRFRQWRWFWDFGGGIFTDLMVHHIDIVHWYLDLAHPASAASVGDWFSAKGLWETPDTVQTLLRYGDGKPQVHFEGTFSNARAGEMIEFMGTEGTLYLDRGRYEITPERNSKLEPDKLILGSGPPGADFYDQPEGEVLHLANWAECVRSRKTPNAPVEAGISAAAAAHLANRSLRTGQIATWKD